MTVFKTLKVSKLNQYFTRRVCIYDMIIFNYNF